MVLSLCLSLNLGVDVCLGRTCFGLETLERECGADFTRGRKRGRDIVRPGKVKVEELEEGRVLGHDVKDELAGEGFVAETFFEFGEDFLVGAVFGVEDGGEGSVFRALFISERVGSIGGM
jgi:hypothetical protein